MFCSVITIWWTNSQRCRKPRIEPKRRYPRFRRFPPVWDWTILMDLRQSPKRMLGVPWKATEKVIIYYKRNFNFHDKKNYYYINHEPNESNLTSKSHWTIYYNIYIIIYTQITHQFSMHQLNFHKFSFHKEAIAPLDVFPFN